MEKRQYPSPMNDDYKPHANVVRHLVCPYCKNPVDFRHDSKIIYHGKDFGPIYICYLCDAYTLCRKGSYIPQGRIANSELRQLKKKFHELFDPKWQIPREYLQYERGDNPRQKAYFRLSRLMRIPIQHCNVAIFNEKECNKAIEILQYGIFDDPDRA